MQHIKPVEHKLILLTGPMFSGKSAVLIHRLHSLEWYLTPAEIALYKSQSNTQDSRVYSRNGLTMPATKIASLTEIPQLLTRVVGIDELHMFNQNVEEGVQYVVKMLDIGKRVVVAGLNCDYRGEPYAIIEAFKEIDGVEVYPLKAVCSRCGNFQGEYTQILKRVGHLLQPIVEGLPPVLVEDTGLVYQARCPKCFVYKETSVSI